MPKCWLMGKLGLGLFRCLCRHCCLRNVISLQITDLSICNSFAISDWLQPLLESSSTRLLLQSICCFCCCCFLVVICCNLSLCFYLYVAFSCLSDLRKCHFLAFLLPTLYVTNPIQTRPINEMKQDTNKPDKSLEHPNPVKGFGL
jgi:hypothetical protein